MLRLGFMILPVQLLLTIAPGCSAWTGSASETALGTTPAYGDAFKPLLEMLWQISLGGNNYAPGNAWNDVQLLLQLLMEIILVQLALIGLILRMLFLVLLGMRGRMLLIKLRIELLLVITLVRLVLGILFLLVLQLWEPLIKVLVRLLIFMLLGILLREVRFNTIYTSVNKKDKCLFHEELQHDVVLLMNHRIVGWKWDLFNDGNLP